MAMRWILTWKEAPDGAKAKEHLVAKGLTDPDLLTIREEAPTLSKTGRHCILQMSCSHNMKFDALSFITPVCYTYQVIEITRA